MRKNGLSPMPNWENSRTHTDETHHIDEKGKPLYPQRFKWVLPFHSPGLAPVADKNGAYHIKPDGTPAYEQRFDRTFGYYQGRAAVIDKVRWYHILSDGKRLYKNSWDWCGNFQNNRCPVRDKHGDYYHIKLNGKVTPHGPWKYAGDYREDAAVVRGRDGLCRHIDKDGKFIHEKAFYDLDVYHKGYARARDSSGWFHINREGNDISGRRYDYLEPFYNGQALAHTGDGSIMVISEEGNITSKISKSSDENRNRLHKLSVSYWAPFAVKLGLDAGLAGGDPALALGKRSMDALKRAWIELGLLDPQGEDLTELGSLLMPGEIERDRFDFWMGIQLEPWLNARERLKENPESDFFEKMKDNPDLVYITQRVLDSYAKEDWKGISKAINLSGYKTIVDLGGGQGTLLKELLRDSDSKKCILIERPEVAKIVDNDDGRIEVIPSDIFTDKLPKGDVYFLSRVLHDWNDKKVLKILKNIAKTSPTKARLIVIDRLAKKGEHGLLDLNMLLATGGKERSLEEMKRLFDSGGWTIKNITEFHGHNIMDLKKS